MRLTTRKLNIDTYRSYKSTDRYSYVASPVELKENEYNLNIPRYVNTFEGKEPVDIKELQKEIFELEGELKYVRSKMNEYLKELGVLE